MKHIIKLIGFMSMIQMCSCSEIPEKTYKFQVEVVDESGNAVQDAKIRASRYVLASKAPVPTSKPVRVEVPTDRNGIAAFSFSSVEAPGGVAVVKDGYYSSTASADWDFPEGYDASRTGKTKIDIILKPVKNPIPMHANLMTGQKVMIIPEMHKDYSYDLQRAAMVAPLGEGVKADLIIRVEGEYRNENGMESKIAVTIRSVDENDGFVYFETPDRERGSSLLGDYQAPENGYASSLVIPFDSSESTKNMSRKNEGNYYFRCRTVRDANGRIIQSNYGKIHGDFIIWSLPLKHGGVAQISWIASYFNPTPNDRNIEFDPKRNLNPDGNVQQP